MFQFRKLEMRNWDFWQSIEIPLDAQIVTIVGPNGSGKTTLLDALRTLLALRCSGRRDYKRYVRNSTEPTAWLRGVVDNPRREGGGLFPYPFFPIVASRVTLFCRVKKQGGDWARHYAIADGEVELTPESEEQLRWMGVNEYKMTLEQAGLTRAIAEVLALEQGDTDKLCEYSPKALLDLVFQVFGDKQVLDNYQQAKAEQKEAEAELVELEGSLSGLGNKVEQMKGRANRYLEWRDLQQEMVRLEKTALPGLRYLDAWDALSNQVRQYKGVRRQWRQRQAELTQRDVDYAQLQADFETAQRTEREADERYRTLFEPFQRANIEARAAEGVLGKRDKLKALAEAESGADAVQLAERLGKLRGDKAELDAKIRVGKDERQQLSELQFALQQGRQPAERFVRDMRAALDESGIPHQMLTDIVEVNDSSWQGAVEALLAPYRHIILLNREADREAAFRIGQRLQYRHFIVPERESSPKPVPGSILEVVDFRADAPSWLTRQLNNVQRVKSVEAAANVSGDWITRDGYHKERRGGRHIGVDARDHAFGEGARHSRLEEVSRRLRDLNQSLLDWEGAAVELGRQASSLQLQLAGMDAVQQLAAQREEFEAAEQAITELREQARRLGAELGEWDGALRTAREATTESRLALDRANRTRDDLLRQVNELSQSAQARLADLTRLMAEARNVRAALVGEGVNPAELPALKEEWGSMQAVRHEIERLGRRMEVEDFERDASVLELKDKIQKDYELLADETAGRAREVARARELTEDARGAYIGKLRATVRAYALNVKRLGELSGIHVELDMPHLDNDDAILAQAGLIVRFDFDQKGLMGLNDGEASGGQQVMKSLILLIGLMMDEANPSGFVFIDEPFAHLDVLNIDKVGAFLKATQAQYLITTPLTHNLNAFTPSELTLCTYKKRPSERWAPIITQTRRRLDVATSR